MMMTVTVTTNHHLSHHQLRLMKIRLQSPYLRRIFWRRIVSWLLILSQSESATEISARRLEIIWKLLKWFFSLTFDCFRLLEFGVFLRSIIPCPLMLVSKFDDDDQSEQSPGTASAAAGHGGSVRISRRPWWRRPTLTSPPPAPQSPAALCPARSSGRRGVARVRQHFLGGLEWRRRSPESGWSEGPSLQRRLWASESPFNTSRTRS